MKKVLLFVGVLVIALVVSGMLNVQEGAISEGPYNIPKTLELLDELNNLSNGVRNGTITTWSTYAPYFSDPIKTEMMNETPSGTTKDFIKKITDPVDPPNMKDLYTSKNFSDNVINALKDLVHRYYESNDVSKRITDKNSLTVAKRALTQII